MRINEVSNHIQHLPSPKKNKHCYIVPLRALGTHTFKTDTIPEHAHVVIDGQVISDQKSDIHFENVGGGEVIVMCEVYGNLVINAQDHDEVESLVKTLSPNLHSPIGDATLAKGRVEIIGNIIRVDFSKKTVMVKVDRKGGIHAH